MALPSMAEIKARRAEYARIDKTVKGLLLFIIPTVYLTHAYPTRSAICKDIATINERLSEAGI
jgi:hypothetical protein